MKIKSGILIFWLCMVCFLSPVSAQQISSQLGTAEKCYAATLIKLSAFLEAKPDSLDQSNDFRLKQDSVINQVRRNFFSESRMLHEFRNSDTNYFNVEAKVQLQKNDMSMYDLWMTKLPSDSLLITSSKTYKILDKEDVDQYNNSLALVFGVDRLPLFLFWFDENSCKIISMLPIPLQGAMARLAKYFTKD